jgi:hypothetical protein
MAMVELDELLYLWQKGYTISQLFRILGQSVSFPQK